MIREITKNIYRIYVEMPNSPLKNLNAYLIKGEERSLLVDTGEDKPVSRKMLLDALKALDVDMKKTDIFLTHFHPDHLGLVPAIASKSTRVFMGWKDVFRQLQSCVPTINDVTKNDLRISGFPECEIENSPMLLEDEAFINPFTSYIPISDGTELDYGGYHFVAIDTPGHSPGHMCLYEAEHKILFTGDHVLFSITPNISRSRGAKDSLKDYVDSLMKIRDLDAVYLLPAHRDVTGKLAERVDEIIEHHGERVRETLDVLDTYGGTTAYEIAGKMNWNIRYEGTWEQFPRKQKPFAVNEINAHLDYLVHRGRASMETIHGVQYYYPIQKEQG